MSSDCGSGCGSLPSPHMATVRNSIRIGPRYESAELLGLQCCKVHQFLLCSAASCEGVYDFRDRIFGTTSHPRGQLQDTLHRSSIASAFVAKQSRHPPLGLLRSCAAHKLVLLFIEDGQCHRFCTSSFTKLETMSIRNQCQQFCATQH